MSVLAGILGNAIWERIKTGGISIPHFATAQLLLFVGVALIGFFLGLMSRAGRRSSADAEVELLTPLNQGQVGAKRTVAGSVQPPNTKVQVFVAPGDGWWYTQGERRQATVDDSSWNVECTFGTPETGLGSNYQIIAIANANIRESKISALPSDGIRSEIIKVRRSK